MPRERTGICVFFVSGKPRKKNTVCPGATEAKPPPFFYGWRECHGKNMQCVPALPEKSHIRRQSLPCTRYFDAFGHKEAGEWPMKSKKSLQKGLCVHFKAIFKAMRQAD